MGHPVQTQAENRVHENPLYLRNYVNTSLSRGKIILLIPKIDRTCSLPEDDLESAEAERVDGVRDGEGVVGHHARHGRCHLDLRSHQQVVRILLSIDHSCLGEFVDFQDAYSVGPPRFPQAS